MSAPSSKPSINGLIKLLFPPWRFGSNVKSAGSNLLDAATEACVRLEIVFAGLVVAGVVGEIVIAFRHPAYDSPWEIWGAVAGNATVAIGVAVETLFLGLGHFIQGELSRRSSKVLADANDRLADIEIRNAFLEESAAMATERAAKADLARVELEAKLLPRMLNQDQWDFIQTLRGKFPIVAIAFEVDAETQWFAGQIRGAFMSAGISVAMYPRAAEIHSFGGILIYEPKGFDGARPRTVEPLVEIFRRADIIGSLAVITEMPVDVLFAFDATRPEMRAPFDTPMIVVGGRFVLPPPHLERAGKAAKAAMDRERSAAKARASNI